MLALFVLTMSLLGRVVSNPIIKVGNTDVIGKSASGMTEFFGGVPFAHPPVGQLRLKLPVLLTKFNGKSIDARNFGPGCLQIPLPPSGVSEDCLTLDIYRPAGISPDSKLPVFVWIYGGGFTVGATSFYNGTSLVERSISRGTPILVVSINYRVGPLGFPQGVEAANRDGLNLGLHDQLTALEWIQANIVNFGGDKSKVTIGGESAGGSSIVIHFLESRIKGLARAGIMESAGLVPTFGPERNEANWQEFVAAIPACTSIANSNKTFDCIRKSDTASLQYALTSTQVTFANMSFVPVIDGAGGLIVDRPTQIIFKGSLPTLMGTNLDEGPLFTSQSTNSTAEIRDAFMAFVTPSIVTPQRLQETLNEALKLYPNIASLGSPFGTGNETFGLSSQYKRSAAIFGDIAITSSRRLLGQQMSTAGVPVFAYLFSDPDAVSVAEFAPSLAAPGSLGVPHTSEIPYVFGTLMNVTPNAVALSAIIQDYWISFINNLDPNDDNGGKRPNWEKYTPANQVLIQLHGRNTTLIPDNFREEQIALWLTSPDVLHR